MTKFCVENILVEELRERNLNIDDLLQTHAKKQKKQQVVVFDISDETIEELKKLGVADIEQEIIDAIQKSADEYDDNIKIVIRKDTT